MSFGEFWPGATDGNARGGCLVPAERMLAEALRQVDLLCEARELLLEQEVDERGTIGFCGLRIRWRRRPAFDRLPFKQDDPFLATVRASWLEEERSLLRIILEARSTAAASMMFAPSDFLRRARVQDPVTLMKLAQREQQFP